MSTRPPIYLYTDGAASGNPGPGGWGAVLKCGNLRREMSGGFAHTTNNRMELMAVIEGLKAIRWEHARVEVWSDSKYVVDALQKGWLEGWIAKGWKKVKNPDLWPEFLPLYRAQDVTSTGQRATQGSPKTRGATDLALQRIRLVQRHFHRTTAILAKIKHYCRL